MTFVFAAALFAGAAVIAVWIAVRFPGLAPQSLTVRVIGTLAATQLLMLVPVDTGSYFTLYGSLFGLMLPVLTVVWLGGSWLLQSLRETAPS
ncbi:MAG TPA: hypothetical protein VH108_07620 [Gaiellaceae bacterium]|jgi:hypothetical protein|nr:hypothetical protein [Gaiellaceae bacterium]